MDCGVKDSVPCISHLTRGPTPSVINGFIQGSWTSEVRGVIATMSLRSDGTESHRHFPLDRKTYHLGAQAVSTR